MNTADKLQERKACGNIKLFYFPSTANHKGHRKHFLKTAVSIFPAQNFLQKSKRKRKPPCYPLLFSGYSRGCGVSWLPASPSCLNRKALCPADDAHRDSHNTRFSQLRAQITTERPEAAAGGTALISSQARHRQTRHNTGNQTLSFHIKSTQSAVFSVVGRDSLDLCLLLLTGIFIISLIVCNCFFLICFTH